MIFMRLFDMIRIWCFLIFFYFHIRALYSNNTQKNSLEIQGLLASYVVEKKRCLPFAIKSLNDNFK